MEHLKFKILILFCISICFSLSGKTYYISPGGKDSNPGTINLPFLTLNRAWSMLAEGDIVYMRGGRYNWGNTFTNLGGKSGTSGNYINIWASPGEYPVIDYAGVNFTNHQNIGMTLSNCNYIYLKGIRITNIPQINEYNAWPEYGLILFNNVSNCIFEMMETDHIGGWGVSIGDNCNNNLFLNCDSHHNQDPYSVEPYGGADGYQTGSASSTNNTFEGCRAWSNSDDGWDFRSANGKFTLDNCWSFWNGYIPDTFNRGGDGEGMKLKGSSIESTNEIRRVVKNCLSFENRSAGIEGAPAELYNIGQEIFNNVCYGNGSGMGFYDGVPAILKNNISYNNGETNAWIDKSVVHDHNSFDLSVTVSDADFVSVVSAGMDGPRQSNGSLPNTNFLKLSEGSDLIDAGVDVGIPFDSKAPDLGAFEFQSGLPAPVPVFTTAAIENSTPSFVDLTFDLILNSSIIPPISSFSVSVNSTSRKINSITILGNKVRLTLESPVTYGDIIMLSYSKPATNPLQTSSGGIAENIISRLVTNKCLEPIKPNNPPVVVINTIIDGYSGFVYEIDASRSYDLDKNPLTYQWIAPSNVYVSTTSGSRIQFLSPDINSSQILDFQLTVYDGITQVSKKISINILPYKPECELAKISNTQGSSYLAPNSPEKSSDGILTTRWSASGDNQWLIFTLAQPFKISYLEIAFLPDQNFSSYFDIYASQDNLNWKPIIVKTASCSFSGGIQVFDFPISNANVEYSYIKFIGHGNSSDNQNTVSEIRIFGTSSSIPNTGNTQNPKIVLYPNPTSNFLNISIDEATLPPDKIKIFNHSGNIVLEKSLDAANRRAHIPLSLESGNYLVELLIGKIVLFDQKLIIIDN
jgi:hypothetical protein